jgi:hypothetical protein
MSRIIKVEGNARERNKKINQVLSALDASFSEQALVEEEFLDIASFIAISLLEIYASIDASAAAWEKRGYWVKADKYRLEWDWAERAGRKLEQAIISGDKTTITSTLAYINEKLKPSHVLHKRQSKELWEGARIKVKKG